MSVHNLVIAIGGTGTRIVSELIKNFRNDQQKVPSDVAFAIIDAHRKPEVSVNDEQSRMVAVEEAIWYTRKHDELMRHPNPYLLRSWWPEGIKVKDEVTFLDGCGAIRPNGRFFVAHYGDSIARVISQSLDHLRDANHHTGERPKTNIYIIASLGNGTGGGAFMGTAVIANRLASDSGLAPNVIGILVPSTTTSAVNSGSPLLVPRVGANGVAALVELQYEFNRRANAIARANSERWTETPTQSASVHTLNGQYTLSNAQMSPFSQAFLIDSTNTNHAKRNYDEVLEVAARSIHTLISGADEGKRLLDSNTHVSGNFGSLGFCRLRTPVKESIDYIIANLLQEAEDQLQVVDLDAEYPDLRFNFEPDLCPTPTIKDSVHFVLGTVARINETDSTNPLFDRLNTKLAPPQALGEIKSADECKEAIQTCRATFRRRHEAALQFAQELLHGTAKELPHPRPIGDKLREARDTLGVAYLLRQVATQLVKAGKFKLLAEWLEEFKRQVQDAIASVKRTEYSRVRGFNLDNPPENLEGYLQRYQELSNSLFSFFKRSSRDEALSNATSELESWYRGGIVHMEVMGVLKFYEDLMGIVDMYVSTIHSVCQSLEGRLYSQHTDEERNKALRFFDDHLSKGTGRVSNTLEVIVGSRQDIDSILTQLRRDLRHDGQGLFAALHQLQDQHLSIFQQAADRLEISYALLAGPKAAKPEGGLHWASLYGEQLKAQIRHITQGTIASAMGLEALLQRQAESAIERFLNNAVKAIQQGTLQVTPSAMAADDELRRVMSKRYSAARDFLMQPTPDVRGAVKLAIRNYIDLVMNLANANWYPQTRDGIEQRQMLLLRSPRDGSPFADVMDELKGSKISVTHSPYFDLNRIDCVTCEVGARIEDIHDQLVKPHLDNYRRTLFPAAYDEMASDYTPHSERHYIDAGHNYLRWLDRRATAHQNGALLIALGLFQHADLPHLFGFFERTTEGYRWKRELRSTDGNRILATTGTAIAAHTPRELINWLNGVGPNSENGRITSDALRQALNADLQHLVYGDPKASIRTGLGLEQAKECFMRHKAQLRDLANSDTVAPHKREALLEQVQFLTGFVAAFDGATPTTLQHLLS